MDKLEQAMQSEDFWVELADTSFGEAILAELQWNNDLLVCMSKQEFF